MGNHSRATFEGLAVRALRIPLSIKALANGEQSIGHTRVLSLSNIS